MKIAILSLVLHTNYGGILQSYALQTILERMGHEVEVLSKPFKVEYPPFYKYPLCIANRVVRKILFHTTLPIFNEHYQKKIQPILRKNTDAFIKNNLHVRYINSFSEIKESDYDAIIVGSDQVWRPVYFKKQWQSPIQNAFLSFTKGWNIKRIAYAPSLGVDNWEYSSEETKKCGDFIKLFHAVSVREKSGVDLLKQHLGVTAQHVLDPTMLLTKEDYESLIQNEPKSNGNLLVYMLDDTELKQNIVTEFAKQKHLEPFSVIAKQGEVHPKVETWLKGFQDAEFVITDSFHACVFSIIFNKPFLVIGNKARGLSRFSSLLSLFNLSDCLISNITEIKDINISNSSLLEKNRQLSYNYLSKALQ